MKKVVFIGHEKGSLTPEAIARYLKKHGHFEGIHGSDKTWMKREFITYSGKGYQIVTVAGETAQIIEMPEEDCKRIGACSHIQYGGF